MSKEKEIAIHTFVFNHNDNGGEQISLTTRFFDNGDPTDNLFWNQEITLQSYCNSSTLSLYGAAISPDALRQLANELEKEINKHQR